MDLSTQSPGMKTFKENWMWRGASSPNSARTAMWSRRWLAVVGCGWWVGGLVGWVGWWLIISIPDSTHQEPKDSTKDTAGMVGDIPHGDSCNRVCVCCIVVAGWLLRWFFDVTAKRRWHVFLSNNLWWIWNSYLELAEDLRLITLPDTNIKHLSAETLQKCEKSSWGVPRWASSSEGITNGFIRALWPSDRPRFGASARLQDGFHCQLEWLVVQ